eukprot:9901315-Alexandrium_andersonii.AAC.1
MCIRDRMQADRKGCQKPRYSAPEPATHAGLHRHAPAVRRQRTPRGLQPKTGEKAAGSTTP